MTIDFHSIVMTILVSQEETNLDIQIKLAWGIFLLVYWVMLWWHFCGTKVDESA